MQADLQWAVKLLLWLVLASVPLVAGITPSTLGIMDRSTLCIVGTLGLPFLTAKIQLSRSDPVTGSKALLQDLAQDELAESLLPRKS